MALKVSAIPATVQRILHVAGLLATVVGVLFMHSPPAIDHSDRRRILTVVSSNHETSHRFISFDFGQSAATVTAESECHDHPDVYAYMAAPAPHPVRSRISANVGEEPQLAWKSPHAGRAPPWTQPRLRTCRCYECDAATQTVTHLPKCPHPHPHRALPNNDVPGEENVVHTHRFRTCRSLSRICRRSDADRRLRRWRP